jgi:hypothetical protein
VACCHVEYGFVAFCRGLGEAAPRSSGETFAKRAGSGNYFAGQALANRRFVASKDAKARRGDEQLRYHKATRAVAVNFRRCVHRRIANLTGRVALFYLSLNSLAIISAHSIRTANEIADAQEPGILTLTNNMKNVSA